jgi:two-component system, sensor histidine kinase and response regulator
MRAAQIIFLFFLSSVVVAQTDSKEKFLEAIRDPSGSKIKSWVIDYRQEAKAYLKDEAIREEVMAITQNAKKSSSARIPLLVLLSGFIQDNVHPDSAFFFNKMAIQLAKESGSEWLGEAYLSYGTGLAMIEHTREAERAFKSAEIFLKETNQTNALVRLYNNYSIALSRLGKTAEAMEMLIKFVEIAEHSKNPQYLALANMNLGEAYRFDKQMGPAMDRFRRGLEVAKKHQMDRLQAGFLNNIALVFSDQSQFDSAHYYFDFAYKAAQSAGDFLILPKIYHNRAEAYRNAYRFEESLKFYHLTDSLGQIMNIRAAGMYTGIGRGRLFRSMGDMKASLENFNLALNFTSNIYEDQEIKREIAKTLFEMGDYKQAFLQLEALKLASDSLVSFESDRTIKELLIGYETRKKEEENKLLKIEFEKLQAEEKLKKVLLFSLIFLFLLISTFLVFTLKAKREKDILNEVLLTKSQEIQQQNDLLHEMNGVNVHLLKVLSHDMRAPISNLKATLDLVTAGVFSPEEGQELYRKVRQEVEKTGNLLETIVAWIKSRQKEGLTLNMEQVDLMAMVQEIAELYAFQLADKQLAIDVPAGKSYEVSVDKDLMGIVLRNIISNAIKFSRLNGAISIRIAEFEGRSCFGIKDSGKGLTKEEVELIHQGKISTKGTSSERGIGIGLALVQQALSQMEGVLRIESQSGKGSTFWICFKNSTSN